MNSYLTPFTLAKVDDSIEQFFEEVERAANAGAYPENIMERLLNVQRRLDVLIANVQEEIVHRETNRNGAATSYSDLEYIIQERHPKFILVYLPYHTSYRFARVLQFIEEKIRGQNREIIKIEGYTDSTRQGIESYGSSVIGAIVLDLPDEFSSSTNVSGERMANYFQQKYPGHTIHISFRSLSAIREIVQNTPPQGADLNVTVYYRRNPDGIIDFKIDQTNDTMRPMNERAIAQIENALLEME